MTPCTAIIPVSPCVFVPAPEPPETAPEVPTIDRFVGRVHCMDALDLMRALPTGSVDAIVSDPPYGLAGRVFDVPHKKYSAVNELWDQEVPTTWMAECSRVLKDGGIVICFGGRRSIYTLASEGLRLGWRLVNDVTWFKPDATPNFTGRMLTESTERALIFCPSGKGWTYNLATAKLHNGGINFRDVWTFHQAQPNRLHPTQKPIGLMQRFIELFTRANDIVLDPFAGSGSTLVAAQELGRRFIGCDLSPEYVAIAEKRLAMPYTLPMPMFA